MRVGRVDSQRVESQNISRRLPTLLDFWCSLAKRSLFEFKGTSLSAEVFTAYKKGLDLCITSQTEVLPRELPGHDKGER